MDGYKLDRDEDGLTANEREVLRAIVMQEPPDTYAAAGRAIGISKQRVAQIVAGLQYKGLIKKRDIMVYTVKGAKIAAKIETPEEPKNG